MARESQVDVMVASGEFEVRTVYGVKRHVPNRFTEAGYPGELDDDYTGWIHLNGQRVAVETGYWGGVLVWRIAPDGN